MQTRLFLMPEQVSHKRRIYAVLDLMGDLGGVLELILLVLGLLLLPISEHSFYIETIKTLFFARTKDPDLFIEHDYDENRLQKYLSKG